MPRVAPVFFLGAFALHRRGYDSYDWLIQQVQITILSGVFVVSETDLLGVKDF